MACAERDGGVSDRREPAGRRGGRRLGSVGVARCGAPARSTPGAAVARLLMSFRPCCFHSVVVWRVVTVVELDERTSNWGRGVEGVDRRWPGICPASRRHSSSPGRAVGCLPVPGTNTNVSTGRWDGRGFVLLDSIITSSMTLGLLRVRTRVLYHNADIECIQA